LSPERRNYERDHSFARILIEIEGKVGYVADVSDFGFKGLFPEPFGGRVGREYLVGIAFDELGLAAFNIRAILRWDRVTQGAGEVGFELVEKETGLGELENFKTIREYYAKAHPR
jgi:hypothetical protein